MNGTKLTLTGQDSGRSLVLHPGDEVEISLPECISGGYEWIADFPESNVLSLVDSTERQALDGAPGAAAVRTFLFKAESPGTCHIRLEQRRSWETDTAAIEQFEITAEICTPLP